MRKLFIKQDNTIIAVSRDADRKAKNNIRRERTMWGERDMNYIMDIISFDDVKGSYKARRTK